MPENPYQPPKGSSAMTFDDASPVLFAIIPRFGARPDIPIASEDFFTALVARFSDKAALRDHLEQLAPTMFRCLHGQPEWIQGHSPSRATARITAIEEIGY